MAVELARECGEEPDFADGFTQGISAVEVSQLIREGEETIVGENQGFDGEAAFEDNSFTQQSAPIQEELIADAQAQIEQMREEALTEIEQMKVQILEDARNQGYQIGRASCRERVSRCV